MKTISRRKFMFNAAAAGAVIPLVAFVSACKSESSSGGAASAGGAAEPASDAPICDLAKLSEGDKAPRAALGYVDSATDAAKACSGCALFLADNGGCPGCTLFKGPVAPEGTCNSWSPKA